ncbi:SRPBCC family protein [Nocardia sp. CA-084685]|uniref:SRPBCC family protein n=1 Tax=Nocardia sp. CA-084685 TaxID=3239970 RepID=UPI003D98083F
MSYRIHNVHQRVLSTTPENLWATLTLLGTDNDPLYPPEWGWVRFPDGLHFSGRMVQHNGVSPITYRITEVEPPRRLWFGGIPGINGNHGYVLEPVDGGTRISHVLSAEPSIIPYLLWTAALHHSHDAISERIFDNLEFLITGAIADPHRPGSGARIMKRLLGNRSTKVAPPQRLHHVEPPTQPHA